MFEPKSVLQTAKECIELLEIQASKKGLELKLESSLGSRREEMLNTDHNRLKQVILNLLSNAVKFTFEGNVTLKIEVSNATESTRQQKAIKVSCIDTGIGISEENQKKLFQAFEKVELGDKVAINSTGVGLGLVISNSIVQRLNSQASSEENGQADARAISLESIQGKGSVFWFTVVEQAEFQSSHHSANSSRRNSAIVNLDGFKMLDDLNTEEQSRTDSFGPLLIANRFNAVQKHSRFNSLLTKSITNQQEQQCNCPKVLIVDDDAFNLTALELHLLKLRILCDSAFNGLIALNKIFERQRNRCCVDCEQYSVVFLDYNMPVMDGIETAKRLRQEMDREEIDAFSIICCTALYSKAIETEQCRLGWMAFVPNQ